MNDLNKDIIISVLIIVGAGSFLTGQFIISTCLFASAAIFTNIVLRNRLDG